MVADKVVPDKVVVRPPLVVVVDSWRRVYHCVSGTVVFQVYDSWAHSRFDQNVCI